MRDINFDGAEITVLKALGSSMGVSGEVLIDKAAGLDANELLDTLRDLVDLGYVECDVSGLQSLDDLKKANFHINSGYSKAIKQALNPEKDEKPSRRVRRE